MHRLTTRLTLALLAFFFVGIASFWLLRWNRDPNKEHTASVDASRSQVNEVLRETESLKGVFSDFVFVANGKYVAQSVPSHGMEPVPVPTGFEIGQQYVLHSRSLDNDLLFTELQNRIRSQGFKIIAADQIGWRYIGGLLFRIRFERDTHQFIILNEPDPQILRSMAKYKGWSADDYLLVIEGSSYSAAPNNGLQLTAR